MKHYSSEVTFYPTDLFSHTVHPKIFLQDMTVTMEKIFHNNIVFAKKTKYIYCKVCENKKKK